MVYVVDNLVRDMRPAAEEETFSLHITEKYLISWTAIPPQINAFWQLEYILSGKDCDLLLVDIKLPQLEDPNPP
jgi:hypothetical protein